MKIKETKIHIPIIEDSVEISDELQRTEDWHNDRNGSWTGSVIKTLMACSRKGGKLSWTNLEKIFMFSDGIVKFIYEKAKQRETNRYIETSSSVAMKYGTRVEPLIAAIAEKHFSNKGIFKEVGYKAFDDLPSAGSSTDRILISDDGLEKVLATIEIKACTSWSTHYDRTYENMDEKSVDFWQTQTEMKSWNVKKGFYLVSEPPKDIKKYAFYDGDIFDLLDDFEEECKISIEEIQSSEIHQNALMERIKIAEHVCEKWLKEKGNLSEIFHNYVDDVKSNFNISITNEIEEKDVDDSIGVITQINIDDVKNIIVNDPEIIPSKKENFKDLPF